MGESGGIDALQVDADSGFHVVEKCVDEDQVRGRAIAEVPSRRIADSYREDRDEPFRVRLVEETGVALEIIRRATEAVEAKD